MKKVSFSQYQLYSTCPQAFKLRYIDKLGESSANIYTIFGTSVHETIQEFLRVMYNDSKKAALELDLNKLLLEWMRGEFLKEQSKLSEGSVCERHQLEEFYEDGVHILNWFKKKIDRFYNKSGYELLGIETQLDAPIKNGVNFIGFIDVVIKDVSENSIIIIDLKTSTNGWGKYQKSDKYKNAQIVLYKKYYSEQFDVPLDRIKVEYQVMRRKIYGDSPFPIPYMSKHIPANGTPTVNKVYREFLEFVDEVFDEEGNYKQLDYPKVPGNKQKNCRFCEFLERKICDGIG